MSCSNCGARFVAYYGHDEEKVGAVEVQKCGLCHGEAFRRDNFKGATIRLLAQVTARRLASAVWDYHRFPTRQA